MRRTIFRFRAESSYDTEEKDHTQTCYHYVNEPQLERNTSIVDVSEVSSKLFDEDGRWSSEGEETMQKTLSGCTAEPDAYYEYLRT